MSAPARTTSSRNLILAAILVAAAVGSATGYAASYLSKSSPAPENRVFYLFARDLSFNFSLTSGSNALTSDYAYSTNYIIVNKGDTLTIHFYNPTDEHHSFTVTGPFASNVSPSNSTLEAGPTDASPNLPIHDVTITVNANQAGTFGFYCIFHPPQMRGSIIVQG